MLRRPTFASLVESMREAGDNTVPIFFGPPDTDGLCPVYDGNSRFFSAEVLNLDHLLGIQLDKPLSEIELIDFGANHNGVRRTLAPEEWARMAERLMEITNCNQEQAAIRLKRSPTSLSRDLTTMLLPDKHAAKGKLLVGSVRSLIAAIKDSGQQDRIMELATTPGPDGRLPARSVIEIAIKRLKGGKKPGRKSRHLDGKYEGRNFRLDLIDKDNAFAVAEWLRGVAKRIEKAGADLPPEGWNLLFR